MTSRKKVPVSSFGHVSSPHCRDASAHQILRKQLYPIRSYWRPPPSWIFNLCEFGHSGVLIVRYLCSVPNLVQISVIVTELDAHMLQTFI